MKTFRWMFCLTAIYVFATAVFIPAFATEPEVLEGFESGKAEFDGTFDDRSEALIDADLGTNPFAVRFCGGESCCTGTFVGPRALLSSGHCSPELEPGDSLEVWHFNNRSDGESLGYYGATKIARNGTGSTGLLLIELDKDVPRYTDVCMDTFQQWDKLQQYGTAGDHWLRTKQRGIGRANANLYYLWPMVQESGDSGGPYMYQNSVAAVHYGWQCSSHRIWESPSCKDIATNLQDGWVFSQGIDVSMRHCRPDRSLGFTQGLTQGGCARVTASGNAIKVESLRDYQMGFFKDAGTITLYGGASASGSLTARTPQGFGRVEASHNGTGITFYERDDEGRRWIAAGTIHLHGVRVSGSVSCRPDAFESISDIKGLMREIAFESYELGECGRLSLLPVD